MPSGVYEYYFNRENEVAPFNTSTVHPLVVGQNGLPGRSRGELVTDKSGFVFFNNPFNRFTQEKKVRDTVDLERTKIPGTNISFYSSINGIPVNPSALLRPTAEVRTETRPNPFGGTREFNVLYIGGRRTGGPVGLTTRPFENNQRDYLQGRADRINEQSAAFNRRLQPLIDEFNEKRLRFAKAANRARNSPTKDPAFLAKTSRKQTTNIDSVVNSRRSITSRARLSSGAQPGLGTGGVSLNF